MNTSAEAADQVVRMTLNGAEVAAKITGAGAEKLAKLIYNIMKDQQRTKGKTRLTGMLKSGKELKVFAVKDEELKRFCEAAKKYGVFYCVLKDRDANDGLTEIMVRAEDASKVNHIYERLNLAQVDMTTVQSEIEKSRDKNTGQAPPENNPPQKSKEEDFLDALMAKPNPNKEEVQSENPTMARTKESARSVPSSKPSAKAEKDTSSERSRPSVREELKDIKAEQRKETTSKTKNDPKRDNQHKAPKKKTKNKEDSR